jgi:dienelactone hydrolase
MESIMQEGKSKIIREMAEKIGSEVIELTTSDESKELDFLEEYKVLCEKHKVCIVGDCYGGLILMEYPNCCYSNENVERLFEDLKRSI